MRYRYLLLVLLFTLIPVALPGCRIAAASGEEKQESSSDNEKPAAESISEERVGDDKKKSGSADMSGYRISSRPDDAGIGEEHYLVDSEGEPINIPDEVGADIRKSLQPALFGNGRYVIYDVWVEASNKGYSEVRVFDLHERKTVVLGTFKPPEKRLVHYGDTSPDQRHVLVITYHELREGPSRLMLYTFDDGAVSASGSTEINPLIRCFARCHVMEIKFQDNDTVKYLPQSDYSVVEAAKEYSSVNIREITASSSP